MTTLLNQPFDGQLGPLLVSHLDSSEFSELNIAVAFAKNSGVLRLNKHLDGFRARGGLVRVFVGVDLGGTSYEALTNLLDRVDQLFVVHSKSGETFHSKIYNFVGSDRAITIVGSNNLTGGGLWSNFESSLIIEENIASSNNGAVSQQFSEHLKSLTGFSEICLEITSQSQIEDLLRSEHLQKEVAQRISTQKKSLGGSENLQVFGRIPIVAKPSIEHHTNVNEAPDDHFSPEDDLSENLMFWFETRKMTGGSRNILDLSMKSLVSKGDPTGTIFGKSVNGLMRGAVEFFGVDVDKQEQEVELCLIFEGVEYCGNTIKFPVGIKSNGSWRLQIKGEDATGRKITDAFRAQGGADYLVEKILVFTRVNDNKYSLTIEDEKILPKLISISRVVGFNGRGKNSRRFGII